MPTEYFREKATTKILKEVLLQEVPVNTYVSITSGGWRVGFTYIDHEDLFIHSLDSKFLSQNVRSVRKVSDPAFTVPIYEVSVE
jgi:hypothetical protein